MDTPETDPFRLLAEIQCPEERARTAREFGLLESGYARLACGSGPQGQINQSIVPRRELARRGPRVQDKKAKKARKSSEVVPQLCPHCGRYFA